MRLADASSEASGGGFAPCWVTRVCARRELSFRVRARVSGRNGHRPTSPIAFSNSLQVARWAQMVAGTLLAILRNPRRMRPLIVPMGMSSIVAISVWV
jgi:hypothetical protein